MENLAKEEFSDSKNKNKFKFQLNVKKESVYVLLLLALVNWVSHFLYFKRFGLYEDDFGNIGINLGINFQNLLNLISYYLEHWHQGHPLAFLPAMFTYIGGLTGSFYFLYVIAFLIVTVNSFMMYKILNKVFPESSILAITGALAFCLFPPDTTKLYLLHVFVLQMAIAFFLTATLLYLNNKKVLAYLTIILAIFSYESPFMLFFGVPFLMGKWDKKFWKKYLIHFIILCSMIALMYLYRKLTGETRVMQASGDMSGLFTKIIGGIIIGPLYNVFLFLRAPVVTVDYLISSSPSYWWYYDYIYYILTSCFIFFVWLFYKLKPDFNPKLTNYSNSSDAHPLKTEDDISTNEYFRKIIKLLFAGIIFLCLGYSVSFTHFPPTAIAGRLTSVHLAATIGASIIFGCVCASIFFISERYRLKKYAVIIISLYLTLLVGYNTYAQKEFVESADFQKSFWSDVVKLCPDLEDSTVIISNIPKDSLFVTKRFINTFDNYWDKSMIRVFYYFPQDWTPPYFQNISGSLESSIILKNGEFELIPHYTHLPRQALKDSNVILLKMDENNNLVRIDSAISLYGKTFHLKPKGENTVQNLKKTKLYDLMIKPR